MGSAFCALSINEGTDPKSLLMLNHDIRKTDHLNFKTMIPKLMRCNLNGKIYLASQIERLNSFVN